MVLGPPLVGAGAGLVAAPGSGDAYLTLQALSDSHHRFAVLALPSGLVALLLAGLAARLFRRRKPIRQAAGLVAMLSGAFFAGVLAFILRFDAVIERSGLEGQWVGEKTASVAGDVLGPFGEDQNGPGVATSELASGDVITLDRRTLARKTSDGSFRWNLRRPGPHPGSILVAGDAVLYAGPGGDYEDDLVLMAVDLESGARRWAFHTLGRRAWMVVEDEHLCLVAARPAISSVTLFRFTRPERLRAVTVEEPLPDPAVVCRREMMIALSESNAGEKR
jgi:hypothetical protein